MSCNNCSMILWHVSLQIMSTDCGLSMQQNYGRKTHVEREREREREREIERTHSFIVKTTGTPGETLDEKRKTRYSKLLRDQVSKYAKS